jgi:hypothetical protein
VRLTQLKRKRRTLSLQLIDSGLKSLCSFLTNAGFTSSCYLYLQGLWMSALGVVGTLNLRAYDC